VRWSLFKEIRLPRIITVTQALALVIEQLEGGEGEAAALAKKKASRVSGWLWSLPPGVPFRSRLAVQDGASCTLLAGTERLGDALDRESGEPYLQLDVGLIPIALRFGNAWTSREKEDVKERYGNRPGNTPASEEEGGLKERFENQHVVVWLPVRSPHTRGAAATTWVPRVETAALRTWLEVVHRIEEGEEGGNVLPYVWPKDASPGSWKDGVGRDLEFLSPAPSDLPTELTLLRMSWGKGKWPEPVVDRSHGLMGASLDEWEWLDREQIEQLRQGVVVAVPKDYRTRLVRRLEDTGADGEGQP
jgi:hypothetical protein